MTIKPSSARIRLTVVQFGDYAEGYRRLSTGGSENYYAQRYTVDFMSSLAARRDVDSITVINLGADAPLLQLPNGIHAAGVQLYPVGRRPPLSRLLRTVKQSRPTHLVVMSPVTRVIRWGIRSGIPTLPMFADSFRDKSWAVRLRSRTLALLLNHPSIEIVGNHSLAAALDTHRIGVRSEKIVPFDWPAVVSPRDFPPKTSPLPGRPFRLLFVGSLMETKGVGDAIRAIEKLAQCGRRVELTVIGRGDIDPFRELSRRLGVDDRVSFWGPRSHREVLTAMRDHDAVLVPSHWAYPEGLPMTLYETLCTRTPLLASDHPMFSLKIRHRQNALVFAERNPEQLASRVEELIDSPELYAQLSRAAEDEADRYLCPLKWDRVISSFLFDSHCGSLPNYSLKRFSYTLDARTGSSPAPYAPASVPPSSIA